MVKAATTLSRNGVSDWIIQRVSAVVLFLYTLTIAGYLLFNPDVQYAQWAALYDQLWMRIFTTGAVVSVAAHAWIGMWSVLTDYLTERLMGSKGVVLRLLAEAGTAVLLFVYLIWGLQILWS